MSVKENILKIFNENRGESFSGQELAKKLNVSRNAVWKAVGELKKDGYRFDAVSGKGYALLQDNDVLEKSGIYKNLENKDFYNVEIFDEVTSTNKLARQKASDGEKEGYVCIAASQTEGRGRMGRSFFSPGKSGLYLSIILRPEISVQSSVLITAAAAAAVARAVDFLSGENSKIKWVNDIFLNGKKVCGILTEASTAVEEGRLDYAVLGIGVNVYAPDGGFPKEIENIAGCLFNVQKSDMKNRLAAKILDNFYNYYKNLESRTFVECYREKQLAAGKDITVISAGTRYNAHCVGITDDCSLIAETEEGETIILSSGEISIGIKALDFERRILGR